MNDFKFFQKETANNSLKMMLEQIMEDRRHFPGYERGEINGVIGGTGMAFGGTGMAFGGTGMAFGGTGMAYSIMRNSIFGGGYERVEIRGDMVTLNEGIDNE
jgi:hypothetical protein